MADKNYQIDIGGKQLSFRVSDWAEQASGSVLCRIGDTLVMVNAVMASPRPNLGFFPLTVEYEEKFYAAGRILGSRYMRREGRPADEAIITARLIDRAIRPLFPPHLSNELQVVATRISFRGGGGAAGPADDPILPARLIGPAMRPLFPPPLSTEIQVVAACTPFER